MAAKGSTFDNQLLCLIFNGTAIANIAINHTTSPLTNLYVSLHTSTGPGAGGTQTTNEAAYGAYARVAVSRVGSANGWTVSGASVSPISTITFPTATSGSETESFFAIGTTSAGAGEILYYGPISPTITVTSGVIPQLTTSSTITES